MKKKLKEKAGLTMVEMLAATVILVLLVLMMGTGLDMAVHSYENMIAKSELELLLSTAVDTLADEFRYARKVDGEDGSGFESFGAVTGLKVDENDYKGQIRAETDANSDGLLVLSTGAYGNKGISYKAYEVTKMTVTYHKPEPGDPYFTIYLEVATADGKICAATPEGGVSIRCLNPPKKDTTT